MGDIGDNGAIDTDYSVQIGRRNFNQSYDPINGISRGTQSTASSYTVHSGDTLQSIALNLWGDAAMWYIIADANGLDGGEAVYSQGNVSSLGRCRAWLNFATSVCGFVSGGRTGNLP